MKFHASLLCALAILAGASSALAQDPAATTAQPATKYVRVADAGGRLRNLASSAGEVVLDAKPGTLLAVHEERAGWLAVEPATGMKVWIYGTYLKKTNTPGVAEINANGVRMRPLPSSAEKSFPLPMKLDRGERVRILARADATKPLSEDWVQVAAPAGATAWIVANETKALAAGEDARTAWAAASKEAVAAMPVVEVFGAGESAAKGTAAPAAAATAAKTDAKNDAKGAPATAADLAEADKLMKTAQASPTPDFTAAKAAYAAVIAKAPEGAAASSARTKLEEIAIREEIVRLKSDKEKLEGERAGKLAEAEARLKQVEISKDPLWGRFQARGWLEKREAPGMVPRYAVTWGGKETAEIACGNGRYELDAFVGCEIGVLGVTQRAAVAGAAGEPGTPARVEATRIEVISTRSGG